jgi:hypothetical protein
MRILFAVFVAAISLSPSAKAQTITTFAGGGSNLSDGIPATSANIVTPWGVTFDKKGNLYFAEGGTSRIRKVDASGILTTIAGTGIAGYNGDNIPATAAKLKSPGSIAFDPDDNLFIADEGNHRIRRIDAVSGMITTVAGTGIGGYNGDGIPATSAQIYSPTAVCFDSEGNLYISDNTNYRVRKIEASGLITTYAGNGTIGSSGDGGNATAAQFTLLGGIVFDKDKNLYIADWNAGKVRKVSSSGIISTYAGTGVFSYNGDNIAATSANIAPIRIAMSRSNELFLLDNPNDRVRKVTQSGLIHTVAGNGMCCAMGDGGPATNARIGNPGGLAFDTCGNLYVSQVDSPRIRKISFNPDCLPISVQDVKGNKAANVTLHPNPATETLTITAGVEIETVEIVNAVGQCVARSFDRAHDDKLRTSGKQLSVDVGGLPPGVYMVRVNEVYAGKMVKQ